VLFSHEPNKVFLVPDSCRAMAKTGNSISTVMVEDTIENDSSYARFCFLSLNIFY
jgi:hypothetical protein